MKRLLIYGGRDTEMKEEYRGGYSKGEITSGVTPDQTILRTLAFVYQLLPTWRDDPNRPAEGAEPRLNLQLCKFLDSQARRNSFPMVRFNHEEYQHDRHSVDLSASPVDAMVFDAKLYSIYDPFLVFECKRLPAPAKDREREYVTGGKKSSGGIQRFKLGLHGAKLDLVAIIGYIQARDAQHWHTTINRWISSLSLGKLTDGCVWDRNEKLGAFEEDAVQRTANCRSVHGRTGKVRSNRIEIQHFWVVMGKGN